jgi:hypothetical protein
MISLRGSHAACVLARSASHPACGQPRVPSANNPIDVVARRAAFKPCGSTSMVLAGLRLDLTGVTSAFQTSRRGNTSLHFGGTARDRDH